MTSNEIAVGPVCRFTPKEVFQEIFGKFGDIEHIVMAVMKNDPPQRAYVYITFVSSESADAARGDPVHYFDGYGPRIPFNVVPVDSVQLFGDAANGVEYSFKVMRGVWDNDTEKRFLFNIISDNCSFTLKWMNVFARAGTFKRAEWLDLIYDLIMKDLRVPLRVALKILFEHAENIEPREDEPLPMMTAIIVKQSIELFLWIDQCYLAYGLIGHPIKDVDSRVLWKWAEDEKLTTKLTTQERNALKIMLGKYRLELDYDPTKLDEIKKLHAGEVAFLLMTWEQALESANELEIMKSRSQAENVALYTQQARTLIKSRKEAEAQERLEAKKAKKEAQKKAKEEENAKAIDPKEAEIAAKKKERNQRTRELKKNKKQLEKAASGMEEMKANDDAQKE